MGIDPFLEPTGGFYSLLERLERAVVEDSLLCPVGLVEGHVKSEIGSF